MLLLWSEAEHALSRMLVPITYLPATYKHARELARTKSMPPTEVLGPAISELELDDKPDWRASVGSCQVQSEEKDNKLGSA